MIKGRDIIVTSLQPWDIEIGSNCKNIALEFARDNRVLYVNSPLDRATLLRGRKDPRVRKRMDVLKGRTDDLVQVRDNLWTINPRTLLESISRIPWNWLFDLGNKINNRRFARQIQSAIDRLGFTNPILFNDSNMFRGFYLKEMIRPALDVYYSRDNLLAIDFWKRHGKRIEPALMRKSDLVVSNSTYLANLASQYNPGSRYVGQGCDLSIYDRRTISTVPSDMASIPSPVIGYTGALFTLRLDLGIIRYLALENPQWSIVLIGPEDKAFRESDLHTMKNVYFLGNKSPEQLPEYVNCFNVAINPQKLNELTIGNYPRKIDEYLALGKPVVALKTDAMSVFAGHTYLATTREEFVDCIKRAIDENTPEREKLREVFARDHSWENNVKEIYRAMEVVMGNRHTMHGLPVGSSK
ncbi:MAG: glycosyltransferase [Bacteroidetes bacterium]|nr:glycosyltransferase [Bacteroidota bacterium]